MSVGIPGLIKLACSTHIMAGICYTGFYCMKLAVFQRLAEISPSRFGRRAHAHNAWPARPLYNAWLDPSFRRGASRVINQPIVRYRSRIVAYSLDILASANFRAGYRRPRPGPAVHE